MADRAIEPGDRWKRELLERSSSEGPSAPVCALVQSRLFSLPHVHRGRSGASGRSEPRPTRAGPMARAGSSLVECLPGKPRRLRSPMLVHPWQDYRSPQVLWVYLGSRSLPVYNTVRGCASLDGLTLFLRCPSCNLERRLAVSFCRASRVALRLFRDRLSPSLSIKHRTRHRIFIL
jgi:hypothetical protein